MKILKNLIIGNSHWKIRLRSLQLEWMRFSHPSDQEVSENIQGAMIDPTQGEPTSLLVQQKCDFPDSFSKKRPFFMIFWYFFIWRSALNIANPYIFWMYVQFPFQWYIIHVYIKGWGDLIIFSQREGWLSISGNPHFEPCHIYIYIYMKLLGWARNFMMEITRSKPDAIVFPIFRQTLLSSTGNGRELTIH